MCLRSTNLSQDENLNHSLLGPRFLTWALTDTMFAGCAINGGFDGGAEAVEQQKVAIVEIVGEAHQAKAAQTRNWSPGVSPDAWRD